VLAVRSGETSERPDTLATEEPMEIRVGGPGQEAAPVAITMRTPGSDFALAAGFLFTEGVVSTRDEVSTVAYCDDLDDEEQRYNVVTVRLTRPFDPDELRRNFFANSSCGVCGKATLEDLEVRCAPVAPGPVVSGELLLSLPDRLRSAQRVFERTGGLHAAGSFTAGGELLGLWEDIGRHNAVDKMIGQAFLDGEVPMSGRVLQVSGRIGFEIVQKAAVAAIPMIAAVSAPSSLAVQAAEQHGMTLVGFLRDDRFNVYSHPERVVLNPH
jgi:FdhD protein